MAEMHIAIEEEYCALWPLTSSDTTIGKRHNVCMIFLLLFVMFGKRNLTDFIMWTFANFTQKKTTNDVKINWRKSYIYYDVCNVMG